MRKGPIMDQAVDELGLVCAFVSRDGGLIEPLAVADIAPAMLEEGALVWLHFNLADKRAQHWLQACSQLPALARDVLLASDSRMRLEKAGDGLVGVIADVHHDFHVEPDQVGVLRLYFDDRFLISARRHPLRAVDKLRHAANGGLQVDKPISLVVHFFHHLTETMGTLTEELGETIDGIEDALLAGRLEDHESELGRTRRLVARLRRNMVPQRHTLARMLERLPGWIGEKDAILLRHAVENLDSLGHDLDLVQERARLLQDEFNTLLTASTNRNLYMLSIVTTIFLPITLITGIFGMNTGGLPGNQDPEGFFWVMVLMGATLMTSLIILKTRKMI